MGKPTLLTPGNLAGAAGRAHPDAVPIDYIIGLIRRRMPEFGGRPPKTLACRVFIVKSKTGSGKSTVLPAYLFRLLRSQNTSAGVKLIGPGVICTQPRILTAQTVARDQAADAKAYPDLIMGVTIGYQTGPLSERPLRGLIYATAGSLLAQLRTMPDAEIISRYRFIIVDEAHERSLDTDALLMRLKSFLERNLGNPGLPFVILASATLPVAKYAAYFGVGGENSPNIVEVEGRAFEIETRWPRVGTNDYLVEAARVALAIHTENPDDPPDEADILIFVPGGGEITAIVETLTKANWEFRKPGAASPPFLILAINREVIIEGGRDYRLLKENIARLAVPSQDGERFLRPSRRIVVSTVVAETGLTIESLKYVIDSGWSRVQEVYFPGRYQGIITRPAPQSRIEQRKGRAGRRFPGVFYPLYTKNLFDSLVVEQLPEIVLVGVSPIFLDMVACTIRRTKTGVFRIEDIDMLDPPPVDALAAALEEAIFFGYLRFTPAPQAGHVLTRLGEIASRFTHLQMPHVQTLFAGFLWRVSILDLAFIVALYDHTDIPIYAKAPPGPQQARIDEMTRRQALRAGLPPYLAATAEGMDDIDIDIRARLLISDDFIEALCVFEGFVRALDASQGDLPYLLDWCEKNGVDFDGAVLLTSLRDEVINDTIAAGINPFWGDGFRLADAPPEGFLDTVIRLKHCIYAGLRFQLITYDESTGAYRAREGGYSIGVPPRYAGAAIKRLKKWEASDAVAHPRHLISNTLRVRPAKPDRKEATPPFLYRLATGLVSILDGYVNIDREGEDPRLGVY